jgi:aldose 1-epimerase
MRPTIRLAAGRLSAEILPTLGGGVARFDMDRSGRRTEVFRAWPGSGTDDPNELGLYVLLPWSNRISGAGFNFGNSFHPVAPNFPGESCPIHGDGWISPWRVFSYDDGRLRLEREAKEVGPYRYHSVLEYLLDSEGMLIRLEVINHASMPLPYGLGFHPWLPRSRQTRLLAPASAFWLENAFHLPIERVPTRSYPELDFSSARSLPDTWVNNCFVNWNGSATILWADRGLALDVEADWPLRHYILYSPMGQASFFCFEPVSHAVDAHHLPPGPENHGLIILEPGASLSAQCRFSVREIESELRPKS